MSSLAAAVHRALLRAYPRAFRHAYGADLHAIFLARVRRARQTGRTRAAALACWLLADAVMSGLAERARSGSRRWARPRQPAVIADLTPSRSRLMSWETLTADVRFALRQMRRTPMFAAAAMLTLALGIGANSAIVSVVHAVLLRPLPYAEPDRLVSIWSDNTRESNPAYPVSPANFEAFRTATSFHRVEAMYSFLVNVQVRVGDALEPATVSSVTSGMFGMLGRPALHGRTLGDGDEQAVVLSHTFWQRRFGGDPGVIGRPLVVAGSPHPITIVGVMPAGFVFPYRSMLGPSGFTRATSPDLWRLLSAASEPRLRDAAGQPSPTIHMFGVVARLRPGRSLTEARTELTALAQARAAAFPETNRGFGVTALPLHDQTVGAVRPALLLLLCGVGVLLLMTCINVANVLLARETGRQRDVAVRAALGASRTRLAQQSLVESTLLATGGGLIGCVFVLAGRGVLVGLAPAELPRLGEQAGIGLMLAFTMGLSLVTGLTVGSLPAVAAARTGAGEALRQSRRTTTSPARRRVRSSLVITQLALATMLTVAGGVLLRSFVNVLGVDPGFRSAGVLTFQMTVPRQLQGAAAVAFYDDLAARLEALPGVQQIGGSTRIPLGSTQVTTVLTVDGRDVPVADRPEVEMRRAVGDYFQAMAIPVIKGRVFEPPDRAAAIGLAVINDALAARVFPGEDPIGRRVRMGSNPNSTWLTIIGVVGSVKHSTLEEAPKAEIYISHYQGPPTSPFMAVRAAGDPAALIPAVRRTLADLGADPPYNVRTMEELRLESVGERRFVLVLVGLFGALAIALAAVGIYGVIALVVSERTAEVGVRLALGATPAAVLGVVVGQAMRLAVIGALLGAAGAALLTRAFASQLYGISPFDPLTFASVTALLFAIAAAAALAPARRAMTIDPAVALRS